MTPVIAGLVAGSLHVVSGPDHLAALAPLAVDRPREGALIGARWGLGHGLGVAALGGLGLLARESLDIEAWSAAAEALVGLMLLAIGLWAIRRASGVMVHTHPHPHGGGDEHGHLHAHTGDAARDPAAHAAAHAPDAARHRHAPLWIGALHGAAGTGHLFGVVPALAFAPVDAALYLAVYGLSAIAAMAAFGAILGGFTRRAGAAGVRGLLYGTGGVAVVVGGVWFGLALG